MTKNRTRQPAHSSFRSIILFFMMGFTLLLGIGPLPAQAWVFAEDTQLDPAGQNQTGMVSMKSTMEDSWQSFLQAYHNRNLQEIDTTLGNLLENRKNSGFANATPYSLALLALAQQAHDRHDDTGAKTLVDQSLLLSPDYSFPYQAKSQLSFSRKQWFSSCASCLSAGKKMFSNYLERLELMAGISFTLAFLPFWLFTCTLIILNIKYFRSLKESWEQYVSKRTTTLLLFALLFTGIMLIWRPFMLLPGLMLVFTCFFPFYSSREKRCGVVLVFLLAISPFAYLNGIKIIDTISSPFFQSVITINFDSFQKEDQQTILRTQATKAGMKLQLFSRAVIAGKEKRTNEAISLLEKLTARDPHPAAAVYNNLANNFYMDNQIEAAIAAYKKAIAADPSSGIYHYNLSHAYIKESFSLAKSEASFIQAWKLSPEIINRQLANGQNSNVPVLVMEALPWSYIHQYVKDRPLSVDVRNDFFRHYYAPWGGTVSYTLFLCFILIVIGIEWKKMESSGRFCPLCGIRFRGIGRKSTVCPSCLHISRHPISDSFSMRQRRKINSFSWIMDGLCFLAGFMVPGTYQLALGQTVRGMLMLCGSFIIAGILFLYHERILHIGLFPPGSAWGPMVFPLLILAISYVVNYYSWRWRQQQRLILRAKG